MALGPNCTSAARNHMKFSVVPSDWEFAQALRSTHLDSWVSSSYTAPQPTPLRIAEVKSSQNPQDGDAP